jgi:MYXO-CTERM domain-containing protein
MCVALRISGRRAERKIATMRHTMSITFVSSLLLLSTCGEVDDDSRCADLTAKFQSCSPEAQIPSTATCSPGALENYEQIMETPCHQLTAEVGKAESTYWKEPWDSCRAPCMLSGSWLHCVPNQFTNSAYPMQNIAHCCESDAYYRVTVPICEQITHGGYSFGNQGYGGLGGQGYGGYGSQGSDPWFGTSSSQGYDTPCGGNPGICQLYGLVCQNVGNFIEEMRCRPGDGQPTNPISLSGSLCNTGVMAACYDNWAINCENGIMRKESCGLSTCRVQQQSSYYGMRERAVCAGYSSNTGYSSNPGWYGDHGYPKPGGNSFLSAPNQGAEGGPCYPGNGRAYTCVNVTSPILGGGGQNPCHNAYAGDPRIVVDACRGDSRYRCCLLLPQQGFGTGFGMADDLGASEAAVEETDTTGGCSVSAAPGAGAPAMLLGLLVLGLVWTRRRA